MPGCLVRCSCAWYFAFLVALWPNVRIKAETRCDIAGVGGGVISPLRACRYIIDVGVITFPASFYSITTRCVVTFVHAHAECRWRVDGRSIASCGLRYWLLLTSLSLGLRCRWSNRYCRYLTVQYCTPKRVLNVGGGGVFNKHTLLSSDWDSLQLLVCIVRM